MQRPAQQLGRYTLTKRLGVGGMAEVFLAHQDGPAGFSKACVVKRILPHLAEDTRFVQLFQREARLAGLLTHTNIVQIFELGEVDGTYFIAMELIDGPSLHALARSAWRQGKPIPLELVCCAIADAALGLEAAHTQTDADGNSLRIVHRDISPDNLMINREGVTKILDFGIARSNASSERTSTGELKGKIPFMAPEVLRGEEADARTDLYALGVTFYWLLTGRRPFTGTSDLVVMQSIITKTPPPPSEFNPTVPEVINDLVMSLLAKRPSDRPQSGADVHDVLASITSSRRAVVAPFVKDVMMTPADASAIVDTSKMPGFLPATPHTGALRSWKRLAPQLVMGVAVNDVLELADTVDPRPQDANSGNDSSVSLRPPMPARQAAATDTAPRPRSQALSAPTPSEPLRPAPPHSSPPHSSPPRSSPQPSSPQHASPQHSSPLLRPLPHPSAAQLSPSLFAPPVTPPVKLELARDRAELSGPRRTGRTSSSMENSFRPVAFAPAPLTVGLWLKIAALLGLLLVGDIAWRAWNAPADADQFEDDR